jgi:hypothetical protein
MFSIATLKSIALVNLGQKHYSHTFQWMPDNLILQKVIAFPFHSNGFRRFSRSGTVGVYILVYKTHEKTKGIERRPNQMQQNSTHTSPLQGISSEVQQTRRTGKQHTTQHITGSATQIYFGHKLGYKVVRGHMEPNTGKGPSRPSEHTYTATIKQEVAPAQICATLSQGARCKGCPRKPTRPCGFVPQPVEQRHRRLAKAPVALHRERHERIPAELHAQVGCSLLLVPSCCYRSCHRRSCQEGADGWRVDDGDICASDALGEGKEDVHPSLDPDAGSIRRGAGALRWAGEAAKGRLQGGGDACPLHYTAQNPFQDIVVQCVQSSKGRPSHGMFSSA